MADLQKREFLNLLTHRKDVSDKRRDVLWDGKWLISEKYDGMRAVWLPSTRGMQYGDMPWYGGSDDKSTASVAYCTGLWSRYGKPLYAPDGWMKDLLTYFPDTALDGELWTGDFEECRSVVSRTVNIWDWSAPPNGAGPVKFKIFGKVGPTFLDSGYMHGAVFNKRQFHTRETRPRMGKVIDGIYRTLKYDAFREVEGEVLGDFLHVVPQKFADFDPFGAEIAWFEELMFGKEVPSYGVEGFIAKHDGWMWQPKRVTNWIKIVDVYHTEVMIYGATEGKNDFTGMVGALVGNEVRGRSTDGEWYGGEVTIPGLKMSERIWDKRDEWMGKTIPVTFMRRTGKGDLRQARIRRDVDLYDVSLRESDA